MSITYPRALPETLNAGDVKFRGHNIVGITRSPFTGEAQTQEHQGKWWSAAVELPPFPLALRERAELWVAWLISLNGRAGTFLMGDPTARVPRGTATGTPVVEGAHAAQARVLNTTGWTPSTTGILRVGDYLQLGSGATSRLHKVLATANSDGSGDADLDIWPPLRYALVDAVTIVVTNPRALFRLTENVTEWDVNRIRVHGVQFDAEEAL